MTARWIRRGVVAVCLLAIVGMIVTSVTEQAGAAITFGLIAAVAILCLVLVTAVAGPAAFGAPPPVDEEAAADVERRIQQLVASGADEAEVRSLVRATARFVRRSGATVRRDDDAVVKPN